MGPSTEKSQKYSHRRRPAAFFILSICFLSIHSLEVVFGELITQFFHHQLFVDLCIRPDDSHEEFSISRYTKSEYGVDKNSHNFHMYQRAIYTGEVMSQVDLTSLLEFSKVTNELFLLELLLVVSIPIIVKSLSNEPISLESTCTRAELLNVVYVPIHCLCKEEEYLFSFPYPWTNSLKDANTVLNHAATLTSVLSLALRIL